MVKTSQPPHFLLFYLQVFVFVCFMIRRINGNVCVWMYVCVCVCYMQHAEHIYKHIIYGTYCRYRTHFFSTFLILNIVAFFFWLLLLLLLRTNKPKYKLIFFKKSLWLNKMVWTHGEKLTKNLNYSVWQLTTKVKKQENQGWTIKKNC